MIRHCHGVRNARRAAWTALGAVVLLAGCTAIDVQVEQTPDLDMSPYETYAFESPAPPVDVPDRTEVERRSSEIQFYLAEELADLGLRQVPREEASLLVADTTSVEVETRYVDPYYASFYTAEKHELGTLTLSFLEPTQGIVLWRGSVTRDLRTSQRAYGVNSLTWVDNPVPPDWDFKDTVRAIVKRLPR